MIYRSIVRAKLTAIIEALNRGDFSAVTDELGPDPEHYFIGEHALSGTRRKADAIRRWYERLFKLFPDIKFQLQRIDIEGPPWRTIATVYWSETNSGTDGVRTENEGVNVIGLRWGKVHSVRIYTDTVRLQKTLERLARSGNPQADAQPIED